MQKRLGGFLILFILLFSSFSLAGSVFEGGVWDDYLTGYSISDWSNWFTGNAVSCTNDLACDEGLLCVKNSCKTFSCSSDRTCISFAGKDTYCNSKNCARKQPFGGSCENAKGCLNGKCASSGSCVDCLQDSECSTLLGSSKKCVQGKCQAPLSAPSAPSTPSRGPLAPGGLAGVKAEFKDLGRSFQVSVSDSVAFQKCLSDVVKKTPGCENIGSLTPSQRASCEKKARASCLFAEVSVFTRPSGANVLYDGKQIGTTSRGAVNTQEAVAPSTCTTINGLYTCTKETHSIQVTRGSYTSQKYSLDIEVGKRYSVLVKIPTSDSYVGAYQVNVEPKVAGTLIRFDGRAASSTLNNEDYRNGRISDGTFSSGEIPLKTATEKHTLSVLPSVSQNTGYMRPLPQDFELKDGQLTVVTVKLDQCTSNQQCVVRYGNSNTSEQFCVRGGCFNQALCTTDSACSGTSKPYCNAGFCSSVKPPAPLGGSCASQSDCQSGLICSNTKCATPPSQVGGACTSAANCVSGLICSNTKCAVPPECSANYDCHDGNKPYCEYYGSSNSSNKCVAQKRCAASNDCFGPFGGICDSRGQCNRTVTQLRINVSASGFDTNPLNGASYTVYSPYASKILKQGVFTASTNDVLVEVEKSGGWYPPPSIYILNSRCGTLWQNFDSNLFFPGSEIGFNASTLLCVSPHQSVNISFNANDLTGNFVGFNLQTLNSNAYIWYNSYDRSLLLPNPLLNVRVDSGKNYNAIFTGWHSPQAYCDGSVNVTLHPSVDGERQAHLDLCNGLVEEYTTKTLMPKRSVGDVTITTNASYKIVSLDGSASNSTSTFGPAGSFYTKYVLAGGSHFMNVSSPEFYTYLANETNSTRVARSPALYEPLLNKPFSIQPMQMNTFSAALAPSSASLLPLNRAKLVPVDITTNVVGTIYLNELEIGTSSAWIPFRIYVNALGIPSGSWDPSRRSGYEIILEKDGKSLASRGVPLGNQSVFIGNQSLSINLYI
ncbi:hypothetical protein HZB00_01345 [Candidatus Woesearchaeota archaeon]|nr:hypothetical protein [Candidatus Woesearchaeota archaeon]